MDTLEPILAIIQDKSSLKSQITHQFNQTLDLISELQGHSNRAPRSINWIGTAWKWIAGSPDATDCDKIFESQSQIIENNNEQYRVNKILTKNAEQVLIDFNKIVKHLNNNSESIIEQTFFNKLPILKEKTKQVVRAAQLAKRGIINTNLFSKNDINQLITETFPYVNEIEAIELGLLISRKNLNPGIPGQKCLISWD